jgi:hypothetical protein
MPAARKMQFLIRKEIVLGHTIIILAIGLLPVGNFPSRCSKQDRHRLKSHAEENETMAGLLTEERLLREIRILYQNRPVQFSKLVLKYYKGARAKQILDTLGTWPST